MSDVSIRASTYSCSHPLVNGSQAERLQSARTFEPSLNVPSNVYKDANDPFSGRPSDHNAANGQYGLNGGRAGLNPQSFMNVETGLRQVAFQSTLPNSKFYDTLTGANRSNWYSQFAGNSGGGCGVYNGPDSYTSTPVQNNNHGNGGVGLTSVDRRNYMQALQNEYNRVQGMY